MFDPFLVLGAVLLCIAAISFRFGVAIIAMARRFERRMNALVNTAAQVVVGYARHKNAAH